MTSDSYPEEVVRDPILEKDVEEWFESEDPEEQKVEAFSEDSIARKYVDTQMRIVRTTMDFPLNALRNSLNDNSYINMSPPYQRRQRWTPKQRSQLIESFLMNIPIPPVFLFENRYNRYEIMDGSQRMNAIKDFLNDGFPLRDLIYWPELLGRRFSELPEPIKNGLLRRTLSAIVLLAETTRSSGIESFDIRKVLFERLNTGGTKLNPQELRNALHPGRFNKSLARLARNPLFCEVWGIPPIHVDEDKETPKELQKNAIYSTMADCELVLRFVAIRELIQQDLAGSLRKLMDNCMAAHADDTEDDVIGLEDLFMHCLGVLYETFDGQPFAMPKSRKTSRPLYDALMVATSLRLDRNPIPDKDIVKKRLFDAAERADTYDILVGRGNTVEAVKERVSLATKILFG